MNNEELLSIYTHNAIDIDYSSYLVINADVEMWKSGINATISAILSDFSRKVDEMTELLVYIKGNRLFFTFEGVKYWVIPSVFVAEWWLIDDLIAELSKIADNVAYKQGELD